MEIFKAENNELVIGSEKRSKFIFPIAELIQFENVAVIRLNVPTNEIFNENVFAVSETGEILWQISKRKYAYENSPYMNLSKSGNYIKAHNWDCLDIVLDPISGRIIETVQSK